MRVCDYVAQKLASVGIDTVFLVQGAANNDLIYSIAKTKGISYVCPMHEQAAGFMAEGYAKVKGVPGVAIATSGPGGQNLVTPICNFFYDSVPGIFITGQVNSQFTRKSNKQRQLGFQEWPMVPVAYQFAKAATFLGNPKMIRYYLEEALHLCQSGRPGPYVLDIPIDVQRAEIGDPNDLEPYSDEDRDVANAEIKKPSAVNKIGQFLRDFAQAKRPAMLIGGGVRNAQFELSTVSALLQIPMFPTWNALDIVPSDHPLYAGNVGTYGGAGRNFGIQNCDLLLAVGCRISGRITGGKPETFARGAKLYTVDIDQGLLDPGLQERAADVNIHADAKDFLFTLERAARYEIIEGKLSDNLDARTKWREVCFSWRDKYDPVEELRWEDIDLQQGIHPYLFARKLSDLLPSNAIIVSDCGGNIVVMNHAFKVKQGQRFITNNGNSPMGFSFAAALGAWFADPRRPVICVIGDGGFNMNIQELQTMKNYGCNVKTFILDNRIYGITTAFQKNHYPNEPTQASGAPYYVPPDFRRVVKSYRVTALNLVEQKHLDEDIKWVLEQKEAIVSIVHSPGFHSYYPKIDGWATPIEDMSPRLPREEFRANMLIDPLPGWETGEYK